MQAEARVGALNGGSAAAVEGGAARKYTHHHHQQQRQPQQSLHPQPQVGTWPHLLAGGVAGAVSKTCTAPLARLTILFQEVCIIKREVTVGAQQSCLYEISKSLMPCLFQHLEGGRQEKLGVCQVQGMHSDVATIRKISIWREASRIVCEEGVRAFWRGNLVTIAHRLPYSSISFYAYEQYKMILQSLPGLDRHKDYVAADVCLRLLGGGLAGITAASMTYPLDLVRTRLAAQTNNIYYRGITHALYAICRDEGPKGLYKGLGATLLGVGPSIAISFSVYEKLRSNWLLQRPDDHVALVSLACGSLSGIASSTVTFPLDLVRRRMQLEGAAGRARIYNNGLFATFGHIFKNEGFRGLYRGILPEYYKVVPSVGIVFLTYESLKSFMFRIRSDY